jgi:hypothetical protein
MRVDPVRSAGVVFGLVASLVLSYSGQAQDKAHSTGTSSNPALIVIQEQGSFAVGGKVITQPGTFDPIKLGPEGQTLHGDHAYVFYQIPVNARRLPLVFLHGIYQFSKTWETTPDGREGFQGIFLRRRFGVYLVD